MTIQGRTFVLWFQLVQLLAHVELFRQYCAGRGTLLKAEDIHDNCYDKH